MAKKQEPSPSAESVPGADFQPVESLTITRPEQLKAITDPQRIRIIELLGREAMTVKQVATRLDLPPTRLYYHVQALEKMGLVQLVDTRVKSGIIEKYYRTTALNITIDHQLLNAANDAEAALPNFLSALFDSTIQEIARSSKAGVINYDAAASSQNENFFAARNSIAVPKEALPKVMEKLKALYDDLEALSVPQPTDENLYSCLVVFFPKTESEKKDAT